MSMTHDEMIAVIQHHKNGGKVQGKANWTDKWTDLDEPTFNFTNLEYRAKPEPLVLWVVLNENGDPYFIGKSESSCKGTALKQTHTIKKFIEEI